MSKKNGRRLFSNKDNTTFFQDVSDISDEVKLWVNTLPVKLKKHLQEAGVFVEIFEDIHRLLENGSQLDTAIETVLNATETEFDNELYEKIKIVVNTFYEWLSEDFTSLTTGFAKFDIISNFISVDKNISLLEANTVTQVAAYICKSK